MISLLLSLGLYAHAHASCFPESSIQIAPGEPSFVSKEQFDWAVNAIQLVYSPVVESMGASLQINALWSNATTNASAYREGPVWKVNAFGGLARAPGMTLAGYTLVLCHEIGHHLGGSPTFSHDTLWAAVEGQADYFSTQNCIEHMLPGQGLNAGLALTKVLANLAHEQEPSVLTPDLSQVAVTYENHPPVQCRLDTFVGGLTGSSRPRCWFKP